MPSFIPIRYPHAQHYSYRLVEFLADIGASLGDLADARNRVMDFMQSNDAQRMPRRLRRQLIREGLYDPARVHEWMAQGLGISSEELDRLFALAQTLSCFKRRQNSDGARACRPDLRLVAEIARRPSPASSGDKIATAPGRAAPISAS